ncbi:hypothetical protein EV426DRAFT_719117 [Tirmania nivea]|nr:hypothetical protein EV426DRAFT_719117 [Tirmania nivea]
MNASTLPITPESFLAAIENLSVPQLHLESHRLLNSIYHLRRSNITLLSDDFSDDPECQAAVRENEEVIRRQEERIAIIRSEVERRGFRMEHGGPGGGGAVGRATNGVVNGNGRMDDEAVEIGSGAVGAEIEVQELGAERDTEVVREVAPMAVGMEEVQRPMARTEPPSQPRELDPVNHPASTGVEDDGVYL